MSHQSSCNAPQTLGHTQPQSDVLYDKDKHVLHLESCNDLQRMRLIGSLTIAPTNPSSHSTSM